MSFLAPLYALGALAIAAPIIFHLIQRRPRGRQAFSSLMFLTPSTPRITRRSRLNHLFLLLLRALALLLLAAAFSRPFLRSLAQFNAPAPARRVAVLIDRSASMRRDGLWNQVQTQVESVLQGLKPNDQVALFAFDEQLQSVVSFESSGAGTTSSAEIIRQAARQLGPGWKGTDLGSALAAAVDQIRNADAAGTPIRDHCIVLLSDLQQGSRLNQLDSLTWPPDVRVDVRPLATRRGNASVYPLPISSETIESDQVRVRVTNEADSTSDSFQLAWEPAAPSSRATSPLVAPSAVTSRERSAKSLAPQSIQVAPGRSRVLTLTRPAGSQQLRLTGDEHEFDNTIFQAAQTPIKKTALFVGQTADTPDRLIYFLRRVQLGARLVEVAVAAQDRQSAPIPLRPDETPLVIFGCLPTADWQGPLESYLNQGGRLLIVLDPTELGLGDSAGEADRDAGFDVDKVASEIDQAASTMAGVLQIKSLHLEAHQAGDYAMPADIDFQNPLFEPFADPKYSDFTKIRVWHSFRLVTDHEQPWTIVARYDDGFPWIVEKAFGSGRCWVMTTGWQPKSSNLALSTKFVPLLVNMLGVTAGVENAQLSHLAGQPIDLRGRALFSKVILPDQTEIALSPDDRALSETNQIGIYQLVTSEEGSEEMAVNLAPDESRTVPLDPTALEQHGVQLGAFEQASDLEDRQRQMRDVELESRQQIWRWLLVAALAVLAVETYVAGRTSLKESTITSA